MILDARELERVRRELALAGLAPGRKVDGWPCYRVDFGPGVEPSASAWAALARRGSRLYLPADPAFAAKG